MANDISRKHVFVLILSDGRQVASDHQCPTYNSWDVHLTFDVVYNHCTL